MVETELVAGTDAPRTRTSLAADLRKLGVSAGETLLVHSSLSSLGWVCGGPVAVVQALLDVLGPGGTLVVPTQTGDNSDPAHWGNPPVPEHWWPVIRAHMPPTFEGTPTRGMGRIAELVRTWPGALRSAHPQTSFAALGPRAATIVEPHPVECGLGEDSPLGRLYEMDVRVLLLGVDHGSNTSLHLAQYRVPGAPRVVQGCAVQTNEGRRWVTYSDVDLEDAQFVLLGTQFDATARTTTGQVGSATARLFRQREAVDFAVNWLVQPH